MRIKKFLLPLVLGIVIVSCIATYACDHIIESRSAGKHFTSITAIPYNKVGLLPGTGKYLQGGYINPYYQYRIEAVVKLIKTGKIDYLIVSGDNSRKDYNEPQMMKDDLVEAGIDSSIIYADYAGFRTFDSVVRLREIFGQNAVTIISQPFHNERAIYIAEREKINAIGFDARDVSERIGWKVMMREKLARVKVFVDYLFHKKPKYLGEKIKIPG